MTNFQLLHQQDINKHGLSRFMHGVTGGIFEFTHLGALLIFLLC